MQLNNELPCEAVEGVVADFLVPFVSFELLMEALTSAWEWVINNTFTMFSLHSQWTF